MKVLISLTTFFIGAGALKMESLGVSFGPHNCVKLSRSSVGSCVMTTECEGVDISRTEFAFDCMGEGGNGDIVRHSFGVGGFENSEEFDTEVKCRRCASPTKMEAAPVAKPAPPAPKKKKVVEILKPAPVPAVQKEEEKPAPMRVSIPPKIHTVHPTRKHRSEKPAGTIGLHAARKSHKAKKTEADPIAEAFRVDTRPDTKMVKYGPDKCVRVWKSNENHCIMSTKCKGVDISNYEFGLVCVDKVGSPIKHMFGKDSFDEEETFDTLVKCEKCMGLEDVPDAVVLAGEVASMGKEIKNLRAVMSNISVNVQMLNAKVFPPEPSAPAPGPAPAGAAPAAVKALVTSSVTHKKRHHRGFLRRAHRRHRHRRDYDDDDDEEEDRDDERDDEDEDDRDARAQRAQVERDEVQRPVQYTPLNNVEQQAAEMQSNSRADDDFDDSDGEDE